LTTKAKFTSVIKTCDDPSVPTLDDLSRYAIARTFFKPTTLPKAIAKLGFVQADPIRAPARAQDLTLRHRVAGYQAGDLERRYAQLPIEEDFFVNYGFVPRATHQLMHPRTARTVWPAAQWRKAHEVLAFVRERGVVHPAEVDAHFAHGQAKNWFGGNSRVSTQLLDGMHYRGLLRIARRENGIRLYTARDVEATQATATAADADAGMDTLVDVVVHKYAPLPERSLSELISHLRGGAPQWADLRRGALQRAKARLASAEVAGLRWYWPAKDNPQSTRHSKAGFDAAGNPTVRLLAPFDPLVWDRRRFEALWGWAYRFEAYTPAAKRVRGYYALPLLWGQQVIGWGNLQVQGGELRTELGYTSGKAPGGKQGPAYRQALQTELAAMSAFLGL
jgi:uncharacterized protein